jgi:hypothetical protein
MLPLGEHALDREAMDQLRRQLDRGGLSPMGCRKIARSWLKALGDFGVDGVESGRVIARPGFER